MTNSALNNAINMISDVFRPERKGANQRIIEGCRLMELVKTHRYTFLEACSKLETDPSWILDGFAWVNIDNAGLIEKYGDNPAFHLSQWQIEAKEWLERIMKVRS